MSVRKLLAVLSVPALAAGLVLIPVAESAAAPTAPSAAAGPSTRHIQQKGTAAYAPTATGSAAPAGSTEILKAFGPEAQSNARNATPRSFGPNRSFARRTASSHSAQARSVPNSPIIRNGPQILTGFEGLNHHDQRTANSGNQYSVEPPDQALCVGNGQVVEAVNDVFRVFNTNGSGRTGVVDLNTFFKYPAAIDRTTGAAGPNVTDPSCLYDPTTSSFFLTVLTLDVDATGALTGRNHLDIAVTKHPTGTWTLYSLDVTDDGSGGTPIHPNCPCIGDYPHIGVDGRGFYITTNEYSFFGPQYNSAQIYAFSKRALALSDADVLVTQFDTTGADAGRNGFTIWPAQSPSTKDYSTAAGGTEFFLSSNAAPEATGDNNAAVVSNSIVTWSLSNTVSLDSRTPRLGLSSTRVPVNSYSAPPLANQKAGSVPLAECLNSDPCATDLLGAPDPFKPEVESDLDSNDTRMQQVTYVKGRLAGALDTAVTVGGRELAGVGWYIIQPTVRGSGVRAKLAAQGKLGLAGNNLIYPAIGLNAAGDGVMAFTLAGDGYYPSAAYAAFDSRRGAGTIYLAKSGAGPQDGFSGYPALVGNPPRPRWGDYGATAVSANNIWMASEYIAQTCTLAQYKAAPVGTCGGTRTAFANWSTRLTLVKPSR